MLPLLLCLILRLKSISKIWKLPWEVVDNHFCNKFQRNWIANSLCCPMSISLKAQSKAHASLVFHQQAPVACPHKCATAMEGQWKPWRLLARPAVAPGQLWGPAGSTVLHIHWSDFYKFLIILVACLAISKVHTDLQLSRFFACLSALSFVRLLQCTSMYCIDYLTLLVPAQHLLISEIRWAEPKWRTYKVLYIDGQALTTCISELSECNQKLELEHDIVGSTMGAYRKLHFLNAYEFPVNMCDCSPPWDSQWDLREVEILSKSHQSWGCACLL